MTSGMGSHQSSVRATDDWITPKAVLDSLGEFDLDPCSCIPQPWPTARQMLTVVDNGFVAEWSGRVWLNPPYGPETGKWLGRLAEHGDGIALVFARTETAMFFEHVWPKAAAIFFFSGRLYFHFPNGRRAGANAGAPSVLIAYGDRNAETLRTCGLAGKYIDLRAVR